MLAANYIQTTCASSGGIVKLWIAAASAVTGSTAGTGLEISAYAGSGSFFWKFEGFDTGEFVETKATGRGKNSYQQVMTVTFNAVPKALLDAVKDLSDECGLVLVWQDGDGTYWTNGYGIAGEAPAKPFTAFVSDVVNTTAADIQENQTGVLTFTSTGKEPRRKFTGDTTTAPFN